MAKHTSREPGHETLVFSCRRGYCTRRQRQPRRCGSCDRSAPGIEVVFGRLRACGSQLGAQMPTRRPVLQGSQSRVPAVRLLLSADRASAPPVAPGLRYNSDVASKPVEQLESVVIRFAGDSGDGMQLTGGRFTSETARSEEHTSEL